MIPANCDLKSIEPLFDRHYKDLVNFTAFLIKDRGAAERLVINLFRKIWMIYGYRFYTVENIRAYLFQATYHEGKKYITIPVIKAQPVGPSHLTQILTDLPLNSQAIIRLFYIEKLSLSQISIRLKIPLPELKRCKQNAEDHLAVALHK